MLKPRTGWTLLALALLFGCGNRTAEFSPAGGQDSALGSMKKVEQADFRLDTLDGRRLGPQDYSGRVVLVDFWATWCLPCRAQAKLLEAAYPRYSRDAVEFLAVDVGEPVEVVRKYVDQHPFSYPVLIDPDSTMSDQFGLVALPSLMVINPSGKVTYFRPGLIGPQDLEDLLKEAGASPAVQTGDQGT